MKLIITLILILVIIGIILITFFCIRKKVRDTSQALFGTPDITQAAVQMKQEYATTPKSVSSMRWFPFSVPSPQKMRTH